MAMEGGGVEEDTKTVHVRRFTNLITSVQLCANPRRTLGFHAQGNRQVSNLLKYAIGPKTS